MEELELSENVEINNDCNLNSIKEETTPGCYVKTRYSLLAIQFLGMINLIMLRNNITVAIVVMVTTVPTATVDLNSTISCPDKGKNSSTQINSNGMFNWNAAQQGLVLGCYFYGYVASNLPGAWLSKRFGMKYTVGIMTLIASVLTICNPLVSYVSYILLVVIRILTGLLQGVIVPTLLGSWGVWGPPCERNTLISFTVSGSSVGTFLNLIISGIIAKNLGWQAIFYITGGGGVLWSLLWVFVVHDYPETHPRISDEEKDYIMRTTDQFNEAKGKFDESSLPWKSIATSLPVWATCVALFASNWGNVVLMMMLPTYMATVLNFGIAASGYLSALPYIARSLFTVITGYATSLALRKTDLSIVVLRKLNQTFSLLANALFLVLVGYVGCNAPAAVAFFCLAAGANAFTISGCVANTVDIAPRYGGITLGMCNTIGNIAGFVTPQVVGLILFGSNSMEKWQTIFWVSAGVEVFGTVFYLMFASGDEQKWAKKTQDDEERCNLLP